MDLHGKRALVTGAAKRLGRAIALELAAQGCHIALHYGRSKPEALATAARIRALGVDCTVHSADLAKAPAVQRLARQVQEHRLGCQILVNSAAVFPLSKRSRISCSDCSRSNRPASCACSFRRC